MEQILSTMKTILAMSVISMLLEFLAPDGALKESVKVVIGIVFLVVIAEPILMLLR
ncbi:MAG: hypothetical protein AAGU74_03350 [Bacillota bacterium]